MENSITSIPAIPTPTTQMSFSLSTDQRDVSPELARSCKAGTAIGSSVLRSLPMTAQISVTTTNIAPYIVSVHRPAFVQPYLQVWRQ